MAGDAQGAYMRRMLTDYVKSSIVLFNKVISTLNTKLEKLI